MAAEVTAGTGQAVDREEWLPRQTHALSPSKQEKRATEESEKTTSV